MGLRRKDIKRYHRLLYGFGSLTPAEQRMVDVLCEFPPLSVTEMKKRLGITSGSFSAVRMTIRDKLLLPTSELRSMTAYLVRYRCTGELWPDLAALTADDEEWSRRR